MTVTRVAQKILPKRLAAWLLLLKRRAVTQYWLGRARLGRAALVQPETTLVQPEPREVVVSIASYGARLKYVPATIASIGRGSELPSRLILVIDADDVVPASLARLQRRGLEILRADASLGPHKKYYPFVQANPQFDGVLVTGDDDFIYPRTWLERLLALSAPTVVAAYRAHAVKHADGRLAPYRQWMHNRDSRPAFVTGGGGAAFPSTFVQQMAALGEGFRDCAPTADDIWLNRQILRGGYRVALVAGKSQNFLSTTAALGSRLRDENVARGANDRQIAATFDDSDVAALIAASAA